MGRVKTLEERIGKKVERRRKRGGGAPLGRTIGVSTVHGYGLRFGNEWVICKTAGQFYEEKYGITFSKPEFQQMWGMTRHDRRLHCLGRMHSETDRRKAL